MSHSRRPSSSTAGREQGEGKQGQEQQGVGGGATTHFGFKEVPYEEKEKLVKGVFNRCDETIIVVALVWFRSVPPGW